MKKKHLMVLIQKCENLLHLFIICLHWIKLNKSIKYFGTLVRLPVVL